MPGILPYGNHRRAWRQWPSLYAAVRRRVVHGTQYEEEARGRLTLLQDTFKPHYVGYLVFAGGRLPSVFMKKRELEGLAGAGRVHLRGVTSRLSAQGAIVERAALDGEKHA